MLNLRNIYLRIKQITNKFTLNYFLIEFYESFVRQISDYYFNETRDPIGKPIDDF